MDTLTVPIASAITVVVCWALSTAKTQVTYTAVLCLNASCVGTDRRLKLVTCCFHCADIVNKSTAAV